MWEKAIRVNNDIDISTLDYSELNIYSKFLKEYDSLSFGLGLTFIFDLAKHCFLYISTSKHLLPHRENAYVENEGYKTILANVNYNDIERYVAIKKLLLEYFANLANNEKDKLEYTLTYKLQLKTDNEMYVPYYLKLKIIATDPKGNAWLLLGKAVQASNDKPFPLIITNDNSNCIPRIINTDGTEISDIPQLSNRELELLQLLSNAKATYEISKIMNIELNTIKSYKNSLFKKLYANNIEAAIEHAKIFCIL